MQLLKISNYQFPSLKKIIEAYNIPPILEVPGYEADDVIGTIAKRADKERFDVYMMTPPTKILPSSQRLISSSTNQNTEVADMMY